MVGVYMASTTKHSFKYKGFITAITANVAYPNKNIYSKKAMLCESISIVCLQLYSMSLLSICSYNQIYCNVSKMTLIECEKGYWMRIGYDCQDKMVKTT